MSYEAREGDISIFRNENATGKQPQYRGTALIGGVKHKVSLWVKYGSRGEFFSGKIEPDTYVKPSDDGLPPMDDKTGLPF